MRPWPDRKPESLEAFAQFRPDELMVPDNRIRDALDAAGLEKLESRFGGLDQKQDWDSILPLREQQLLVIARVIETTPRFVFMDQPDTALNPEELSRILSLFTERLITYVVFGGSMSDHYDAALELQADGGWQWQAPLNVAR